MIRDCRWVDGSVPQRRLSSLPGAMANAHAVLFSTIDMLGSANDPGSIRVEDPVALTGKQGGI